MGGVYYQKVFQDMQWGLSRKLTAFVFPQTFEKRGDSRAVGTFYRAHKNFVSALMQQII